MTRTIDQMISSEVLCCMSSLVATLAHGAALTFNDRVAMRSSTGDELMELTQQAFELAAPINDWEEAAIQAGWRNHGYIPEGPEANWRHEGEHDGFSFESAEAACNEFGIEPYAREVFEHWAVTDWFADKLEAAGEKVDRDFAGMAVWARTTTGQQIAADGVVARIYAETHNRVEG